MKRIPNYTFMLIAIAFAVLLTSCNKNVPSMMKQHTTKESLPFLKEAEWPIGEDELTKLRQELEDVYGRTITKQSSTASEILIQYDLSEVASFENQHFYIDQTIYKHNASGGLIKIDSYTGFNDIASEDDEISECLQNKVFYVEDKGTWTAKACIGSKVLFESNIVIERDDTGQPNVQGYDNQKKVSKKKYFDDEKWEEGLSQESSFYYQVYNTDQWSYDGINENRK